MVMMDSGENCSFEDTGVGSVGEWWIVMEMMYSVGDG